MRLSSRTRGDVLILDVAGSLTLTSSRGALFSYVQGLGRGGFKKLVLNLHNVGDIDCAGIGELVNVHGELSNAGSGVKLVLPHGTVRTLLEVARLLTVFEAYDDEDHAVLAFNEDVRSSGPTEAARRALTVSGMSTI